MSGIYLGFIYTGKESGVGEFVSRRPEASEAVIVDK
jgi:hypothetical protein